MPFELSLIPICPSDSHLDENVEMKDDVQKENRGPPYLVLLFQTQEQFDHVAIDHNNRKKDETYIRLDLEFGIEVHLSEEHRL